MSGSCHVGRLRLAKLSVNVNRYRVDGSSLLAPFKLDSANAIAKAPRVATPKTSLNASFTCVVKPQKRTAGTPQLCTMGIVSGVVFARFAPPADAVVTESYNVREASWEA